MPFMIRYGDTLLLRISTSNPDVHSEQQVPSFHDLSVGQSSCQQSHAISRAFCAMYVEPIK